MPSPEQAYRDAIAMGLKACRELLLHVPESRRNLAQPIVDEMERQLAEWTELAKAKKARAG